MLPYRITITISATVTAISRATPTTNSTVKHRRKNLSLCTQRKSYHLPIAPIARIMTTTTISTATIARVTASIVVAARTHLLGRLPAILRKHYCKLTAIQLVPIQVVHGIVSIATIVELNEGKSTWALGVVVLQAIETKD